MLWMWQDTHSWDGYASIYMLGSPINSRGYVLRTHIVYPLVSSGKLPQLAMEIHRFND